jgi:hypothetical protein
MGEITTARKRNIKSKDHLKLEKVLVLMDQFKKTRTFKLFYSTLFRFNEDLNCFVSTEKWRDKEAELLTVAWWMFAEVAKHQAVPEGFVLIKDDTKTVVAIERMVEQQVEASGMDSGYSFRAR